MSGAFSWGQLLAPRAPTERASSSPTERATARVVSRRKRSVGACLSLPGSVQDIADVVGREHALYLIGQLPRCYVGREGGKGHQVVLYVPKSVNADHPLVRILGMDDASALVAEFGGELLKPPTCTNVYRRFRDASLARLADDGVLLVELMAIFGLTERRVRALLPDHQARRGKSRGHRLGCEPAGFVRKDPSAAELDSASYPSV